MSTTTLCQVCESATAEHRCGRCGAMVCARHYDDDTGRCTACAAETRDTA